jgi:enolase
MSLQPASNASQQHRIDAVTARRIFDSRGRPTVEVDVVLINGAFGRASVPSGASTGSAEAHELRDPGNRFGGRDVLDAVRNVTSEIATTVRGKDARDQTEVDRCLRALDGTDNLRRLGANAVLGVSLAVCRAAAKSTRVPLYVHIADLARTHGMADEPSLPIPMVNIFSGGMHAANGMDVQDFLIVPLSAEDYNAALDVIWRVREAAAEILSQRDITTLLADEGGLSPAFSTPEEAFDALTDAMELAGFRPGIDVAIALDIAATRLWDGIDGCYVFARAQRRYSPADMIALMGRWLHDYPIVSIEDALHEESWPEWSTLTSRLPSTQIVGDDFFATNARRIARGVAHGAGNAVLIKPNQCGTLTDTLEAIAVARSGSFATVVSARSGETEDPFIADLAVGTGSGQIKIGSFRCSDRLSKYNQLARLSEFVGPALPRHALARLRAAVTGVSTT